MRQLHAWTERLVGTLLPRSLPMQARERSRAHLFVSTVLAYFAAVVVILSAFFTAVEAPNRAMLALRVAGAATVVVVFTFVLVIFRATGRRVFATHVLLSMVSLVLLGITPVLGSTSGPVPALYVLVPVTGTLLAGRAVGIGWGVGILGAACLLRVAEGRGLAPPVQVASQQVEYASTAIFLLVYATVIAAIQVYESMENRLSRQLEEERLRFAYLAEHDALTKLPNRLVFSTRIRESMARASRNELPFALLYIDLDGFKPINDRLGHAAGDVVLQRVAARISSCTRENDVAARLGGDEFGVILEGVATAQDIGRVASKILSAVSKPMRLGNESLQVGASLGFALYTSFEGDADALERRADAAMYEAKRAGGTTYRIAKAA